MENKLHTVQHEVNQVMMHQNAELNTYYSVTFATDVDTQQRPADTGEMAQTTAYIVDWIMEMNHASNHMKTAEKISETHHLHLDYLNQTGTTPLSFLNSHTDKIIHWAHSNFLKF